MDRTVWNRGLSVDPLTLVLILAQTSTTVVQYISSYIQDMFYSKMQLIL